MSPTIGLKQPTPRKGTETGLSDARYNSDWKQPTPRKGTETALTVSISGPPIGNNPHPARGRNRKIRHFTSLLYETTHTPQGDGNFLFCGLPSSARKQPTPRKGTETLLPTRSAPLPAKQPTPRKGTETRAPCCRRRGSEKQPTPRKGTETECSSGICAFLGNNPHPARGRKPGNEILALVVFGNNPHPARGRKTICVYIAEIVEETIHILDRGQLTKKGA